MKPKILSGTVDSLNKVGYIFIPGRGRAGSGDRLTEASKQRVILAAELFRTYKLADRKGKIVVAGYKSPADHSGKLRISTEGVVTEGISEAELMAELLERLGIMRQDICIENESIDTVTNFAYAEARECFTDNRAVAIVAQEEHLRRILTVIVPKVCRRDFLGVIVPESLGRIDYDSRAASLASKVILFGVDIKRYDARKLAEVVSIRARFVWRIARTLQATKDYHQQ